MRVALVATSLRLAGAEKQFVYIARALSDRGATVKVFYLGPGDHYQNVLIRSGIAVRQIYSEGHPLFMLGRLVKEMHDFAPQVVLASQFADLIFAAPAGRACHALVLGGVRSDGFYEMRTTGWRGRFLLRLTHGLIANSHGARANLMAQGVSASKIAVLPNVIDLGEFDLRAAMPFSHAIPAGRIPITAVGSLHQCKRFDRFLDVLALARKREPALFGVIAGKDLGAKAALEQRAKALGLLRGHVEFLGECDQIPALLSRSRLLMLCSDYEGFPNVILEAMAARLPVLTTSVGDAALIVENGITGFVFNSAETSRLVDTICTLAQNAELNDRVGGAGRKRVAENYDFSGLAERLFIILRSFAAEQRRRGLLEALEQRITRGFVRPGCLAPAAN